MSRSLLLYKDTSDLVDICCWNKIKCLATRKRIIHLNVIHSFGQHHCEWVHPTARELPLFLWTQKSILQLTCSLQLYSDFLSQFCCWHLTPIDLLIIQIPFLASWHTRFMTIYNIPLSWLPCGKRIVLHNSIYIRWKLLAATLWETSQGVMRSKPVWLFSQVPRKGRERAGRT